VFGAFFQPVAHLPFDDARIDSVAAFGDDFLRDFFQQIRPPSLTGRWALGALRQTATQDLQRPDEGDPQRTDRHLLGGLVHQRAEHVVSEHQPVDLLDHSRRRLAPQHRSFALVGLEFVNGQFLFPASMVKLHQRLGRVFLFVQQGRQQAVFLSGTGAFGIVEAVLDDPHWDAVPVVRAVAGVAVELGQVRAVAQASDRPELCGVHDYAESAHIASRSDWQGSGPATVVSS